MFNFSSILWTGKSPDVESDTIYFLPVLSKKAFKFTAKSCM